MNFILAYREGSAPVKRPWSRIAVWALAASIVSGPIGMAILYALHQGVWQVGMGETIDFFIAFVPVMLASVLNCIAMGWISANPSRGGFFMPAMGSIVSILWLLCFVVLYLHQLAPWFGF